MRNFHSVVWGAGCLLVVSVIAHAAGPVAVTRFSVQPKDLLIAGDAKSGVLVGWIIEESSASPIGIQRIDNGGRLPWGVQGIRIGSSGTLKKDVRLMADHRGGAVVGWREEESGQEKYLLQIVSAQGQPVGSQTPLLIATATAASTAMSIDVDEKGRVYMVWEDSQTDSNRVLCQVIDENGQLRWPAGGLQVGVADPALRTPAIASDHDGGFFVVWHSSDTSNALLVGQSVDLRSHFVWGPLGKVITTGGSHPTIQDFLYTTDHELLVVWREQSQAADTWGAQSLDANGRQRWSSEGISLNPQEGELDDASVSVDPTGKITMAWEDLGTDPRKVFAQQWDRKGLPLWDISGAPVVEDRGGEQRQPIVASEGGGDPYILWLDSFDHPWEIYAQRIKSDGRRSWNSGILVTPAGPFPNHPLGRSDFAGGVVALWVDQTPDQTWELQALRLNGSGAPIW